MGNSSASAAPEAKPDENAHSKFDGLGQMYAPKFKVMREKCSCCKMCCGIFYVILALIVIIKSIVVIGAAISTAVGTKIYSSDLSGRLVAMIILAITAAVTLSITLYAVVGVFRRNAKAIHAASIVLLVVALIQAVIAGVSVNVTAEDEAMLSRSLADSFRLARDENPRHVKIWAATQYDYSCCGVYGPEDYRSLRQPKPDVPISCCPSYVPDRSALVQERDREICKMKKEYYQMGCKKPILDVFKATASFLLWVLSGLIVLELILGAMGGMLTRDKKFLVVVNEADAENMQKK